MKSKGGKSGWNPAPKRSEDDEEDEENEVEESEEDLKPMVKRKQTEKEEVKVLKNVIHDTNEDIEFFKKELENLAEETKEVSLSATWIKKIWLAFETRHSSLHAVVASLAAHINLVEKEEKETKSEALYLRKNLKDKIDLFEKQVTKKDMKSLKLQQAKNKLVQKVSEFE